MLVAYSVTDRAIVPRLFFAVLTRSDKMAKNKIRTLGTGMEQEWNRNGR